MADFFPDKTHRLVKAISAYRVDRGRSERSTKIATFTVALSNGIAVRNIVLHGNPNLNWIAWPSAEYLGSGNKVGFLPIFEFSDGVKKQLQCEMFDALVALGVSIKRED